MATDMKKIEDIFGFPKVKKEREEIPDNEDFSDRIEDVAEVMKDTDKTVAVSNIDITEETETKTEVAEVVELDESIFGEMGDEDPVIPNITTDITDITDIPETIFGEVDNSISTKTPLEEGPLEATATTKESIEKSLADAQIDFTAKENSKDDDFVVDFQEEIERKKKEEEAMGLSLPEDKKDDYTNHIVLPEGEINWIISNESAKFNYFYKQKIIIIRDILRGKQCPFAKYEDELRNSFCDVGSNIFDLSQLYKNMTRVQQLRDRVCQIQAEVNSQYYKWDRTVELLRGVLARTQYERGKQEGVQFEHMRDMEIYLESLKSIHKTADIIHKNLDAAFDLLSRQVTISQDGKPINRNNNGSYNSNVSSSHPTETYIEKETPETLTDYDDLPVNGVAINTGPKVKRKSVRGVENKSWDEIAV